MKKTILVSAIGYLLLANSFQSKAQFDYIKPDDMDEFHSRTLVVVVEKPSDDIVGRLSKKKKDPDAYKALVEGYNKALADAIAKYWKVSEGEVEYKSLDEINDITDKKNYTVLYCRSAKQSELMNGYTANNGILYWPDLKEVSHDKDFTGRMTVLGLSLLEKLNKTPAYQFTIPDLFPTKQDLEYAINGANSYIMYRVNHRKDNQKKVDEMMLQEFQPTLKDKTLLLRRDLLDKKLTKTEIAKAYPFDFMIAGKDTIDRAIDSADAKYAVAIVTPYDLGVTGAGGAMFVQYVYNPEDDNFLASSGIPDMPSAPSASNNVSTVNQGKPIITKKTLQDFCMYINDDNSSDKGGKKKKK